MIDKRRNRQNLRDGSVLLTLFLIVLTIGLTRLLFDAISSQSLASGGRFFHDSPIERPTPTRRALPPAPVEPMTDPDVIAAYEAKHERPPTPTPRTRSEYPTRRPHPTETPSTGISVRSTPTPVRTRSGAGDIAQSNIAMGTLSTATPSLDYVYSMPISLNEYWHKDYTWKGVGAEDRDILEPLNLNWWRSWTYRPTSDSDPDLPRQVFAPFNVSPNPYTRRNWANEMARVAREFPGRVWLLYNEMDTPLVCPNDQEPCYYKTDDGQMCANKMVHAVMAARSTVYAGGLEVIGTPTYEDLHSFNPNRVFEWPPPASTPSPTPGGPYFLDRVDPCEDLYPTSTPRPSYLVNTVTRSLTKYDGTTESWDIPEIEDAMAEVLAQDYAAFYSVIKAADPSARVFCCGNFTTFPSEWWWSFLYHLGENHPDVHLDGVHLHTYPWTPSTYYQEGGIACGHGQQWSTDPEQIWVNCLQPILEVYMDFHDSLPETRHKPIWISEYGVMDKTKGGNVTKIQTYLMEPMAGWIGRSDHHYTGIAWFVTHTDLGHITDNTELMVINTPTPTPPTPTPSTQPPPTSTPVGTVKAPLGERWAAYTPTVYPPTSTPSP